MLMFPSVHLLPSQYLQEFWLSLLLTEALVAAVHRSGADADDIQPSLIPALSPTTQDTVLQGTDKYLFLEFL